MKMKIKKIVAREGLIILSIVILSGIALSLPETVTIKEIDKPIDLLQEKRLKITDTKTGIIYTVIVDKKYVEEKADGFNFTKADALKELGSRGKLESIKDLNIIKKELPISKIKFNIFLCLLLAYPVYLLFRFIIWAIKTLMTKESHNG